ncbi:MAG: DUF1592 domain-containing protein [Gemmataceae bacterium]|nr:DUF1592 domain-containing protein [Gemmataceae bacterium]MDW8266217.1 DUF1592 domain-containing protein [Gemmataceae bacterium]
MARLASLIGVLALISVAGGIVQADEAPASFQPRLPAFVEAHCLECHGPDVQRAGFRLDTLRPEFGDARTAETWAKVHDKLRAGEMPPKKRERPPQEEVTALTRWLDQELRQASLKRQQTEGRVVIRRLNATEYENTVSDLVGMPLRLKELLPEENSAGGFDNVSTALEMSATHLLRYQEAAEAAIRAVVPVHPPIPVRDRRKGSDMPRYGPNFRETLGRSCRLDGDALIIYSRLPRYGLCATAPVRGPGRYRVRLLASAVGADQKPVSAAFLVLDSSSRDDPTVWDCRDIPPGPPQVIEVEIDLKPRQAFVVNLLTRWDIRAFKRPIEEYTGPGIRVEWLEIEGPIDPWPPAAYRRMFGEAPLKPRSVVQAEAEGRQPPRIGADRPEQAWYNDPLVPTSARPKEDAERLIRAFLPRAFRRPVPEEVQRSYVQQVHERLDRKDSFFDAMLYGYKAILSSPYFLLFVEPGPDAQPASTMRLDDYALANRLSYFLWSTLPDDELLAVAGRGELRRPEVLRQQVERLLNDPKARRFTKNFTGQWLDLRQINATIPDPQLYGDFDGLLLWSMPQETELFFEEILRHDRSLLEFVDSDWSIINGRLAQLYGIPGVEGTAFRKVKLPPGSHRGGVMTQASILKVTADGTRTSPVLRGKWVLERIIGKPPAPPPPDIPALEPDIRGATTIRQQLDKHRSIPSCASCHNHIDPPGFALETFDPIGNWRDFYRASVRTPGGQIQLPNYTGRPIFRGPDVEKGGQTADGRTFRDIDDYKKLLLEDPDQLARNLVAKLLVYATGAELHYADREVVEQIVANLRGKNYGFRSLIHEIVQSRPFLNK